MFFITSQWLKQKKPKQLGPKHLRALKVNEEKEGQTVMEPATTSDWTALGEAQFW